MSNKSTTDIFVYTTEKSLSYSHLNVTFNNDFEMKYGTYIVVILILSTVCCVVPSVHLIKTRSGSFFSWKTIDRFSMYTMVTDLLFYFAQTFYGTQSMYYTIRYSQVLPTMQCTISGTLILGFAHVQQILNMGTALFVAHLILRNRQLNLGRYDWRLFVSCVLPTILAESIGITFGQFEKNYAYCGYKEEKGFHTMQFFALVFSLFTLFVIACLYLTIFIYVKQQKKKNEESLKRSAVNAYRLAFKLSLYVAVYVLQFGGNIIESMYAVITGEVPEIERAVVMFLTTSGGIMNGVVYLLLNIEKIKCCG